MNSALRFHSWEGIKKQWIDAIQIKSPSDARKLAPFVDEHSNPLTWVNWSKPRPGSGKKAKPHFRRYPKGTSGRRQFQTFDEELAEREKVAESPIHKTAKLVLSSYLEGLLRQGFELRWAYKDESVSDFPMTGNLLSCVNQVATEYKYKTPFFDKSYQFDIVLLGEKVSKEPLILGAIEIEKENKFGLLKCLISKSLGFPLISVNIDDLSISDITADWAKRILSETTTNSDNGQRRNYIYIHNSLYPVYCDIPKQYHPNDKHQYVIFCKEVEYDTLVNYLREYKKKLKLTDIDVHIDCVNLNAENIQSNKMFANEGSIAGNEWQEYSNKHYIRLTLKVPYEKQGPIYLYHLVIARLVNAHFTTLAGYKYAKGISNDNPSSPIWVKDVYDYAEGRLKSINILQKQMSEPIEPIIEYLKKTGIYDRAIRK